MRLTKIGFAIGTLFFLMSLSGCSQFLTVGSSKGLCSSGKCNYTYAGVCDNVIDIYKHKNSLVDKAYMYSAFGKKEGPYIPKNNNN